VRILANIGVFVVLAQLSQSNEFYAPIYGMLHSLQSKILVVHDLIRIPTFYLFCTQSCDRALGADQVFKDDSYVLAHLDFCPNCLVAS
jgi:hypothetical protein